MTLSNHPPHHLTLLPLPHTIYIPHTLLPNSMNHSHNHNQNLPTSEPHISASSLYFYLSNIYSNPIIMHQAIPYRSWRLDLHSNHTANFTAQPLNIHSHSIDSNNNNNSNNKNKSLFSVSPNKGLASDAGMVLNMVSENSVIVFGRRGCCMSHVVKSLLVGLGVNPAVYEIEEKDEEGVARELEAIVDGKQGNKVQFPAVFIGGKLFGGLDRLMATHISGELVPMLKEAGALWL